VRQVLRHWCVNRGVLTKTLEGFDMVVIPSEYISSEIFFFGTYDEPLTAWIKANVTEGSVCWDVGAGIGWIALLLGRVVGPKGHVDAFEAFSPNFQQLLSNVELNEYEWVRPYNVGICDQNRTLWFSPPSDKANCPRNNSGLGYVSPGNHSCAVPIAGRSLDFHADITGLMSLDFIKIDVEGSEVAALRGGEKTIRRFRPKIAVEYNQETLMRLGASVNELDDLLDDLGYERFVFRGKLERLALEREMQGCDCNSSFNVYCYPRQ
jgi:FkbM family methyltransferase